VPAIGLAPGVLILASPGNLLSVQLPPFFLGMPPLQVAVLASGHGSNLQALLDAFRDPAAPARIALVISNKAGAGALERARQDGVPTATIAEDGQDVDRLLALLTQRGIGLVVLAGYLKKVPDSVVAAFRGRMLNVHPALLPCFGGAGMYGRRVHEAVLASGARVSGVTVHLVDELYDHGRILAQWPVPVRPGDTADTLAARVLEAEHKLLPAVVSAFARCGGAPVVSLAADALGPVPSLPPRFDDALTIA
jgi:phosphoribosylglycinamide formyltransferase-1